MSKFLGATLKRRNTLTLAAGATFALAAGRSLALGTTSSLPDTPHDNTPPERAAMHAINPPGNSIPNISQAMLVESGKLLLLSGHVPMNDKGEIAGPSLEDQLEQVFVNLTKTLGAAGGDFSNVARLTIYVRDLSPADLPAIRSVRDRHIDQTRPPASALIGVAALFTPDVRVEVDAIAALA